MVTNVLYSIEKKTLQLRAIKMATSKVKVRGRAARQEFYLQQLAAIAKGITGLGTIGAHAGTHECSHICHEVSCFNPDHIVVEPASVNKSRSKCVKL